MDLVKKLRINNIIFAVYLLLNNTISAFIYSDFDDYHINVIVSVVMIVLSLFGKTKSYSYVYLIVGVIVAYAGTDDNFAAIFLIIVSCYMNRDRSYNVFCVSALIGISIIRYGIMKFDIPPFLNMMGAYFYFGYLFYNIFFKSKFILHRKGLTVEKLETIEMLLAGKSHEQAAKKLHIERSTYSGRVGSLRKHYDVKNELQLALALIEDGIISVNSSSNVKIDKTDL